MAKRVINASDTWLISKILGTPAITAKFPVLRMAYEDYTKNINKGGCKACARNKQRATTANKVRVYLVGRDSQQLQTIRDILEIPDNTAYRIVHGGKSILL